jgi:hypothetical protein
MFMSVTQNHLNLIFFQIMRTAQTLGSMPLKTTSAQSYKHLQPEATLEKLYSREVSNTPIYQTTTHNTLFQQEIWILWITLF